MKHCSIKTDIYENPSAYDAYEEEVTMAHCAECGRFYNYHGNEWNTICGRSICMSKKYAKHYPLYSKHFPKAVA